MYSVKKVLWKFTKNELLHKSFQVFSKHHFPEQLFMGHSLQRIPNTLYVMNSPQYSLPHLFQILFNPSSLLPLTFTSTAIFDILFLWLNVWSSHYSTLWYYGSVNVEPWYLNTTTTLIYVLCNKASNLLRSDT